MAVDFENAVLGTITAATETDIYTNSSGADAVLLSATVTCIDSGGFTAEIRLTDGSNNIREWIIPPGATVGYNNGLVEMKRVVIPNGYKIRGKCSVTLSSFDKGGFSVNVLEMA